MPNPGAASPGAVGELNEVLLAKAANPKALKTDRVRADGTVVPANVGYPTDSGLMARGVIRMVAVVAACTGWVWPPALSLRLNLEPAVRLLS